MAGAKRKWLVEVVIYTLAGSLTSALVGGLLGWLGGLFLPGPLGPAAIFFAVALAGIAIARELRWISFRVPQVRRQTKDFWGKIFPGKVAALLWGLDLGLIFTTRLTFAGVWLLVVLTLFVGETPFGAALFVLYWLGRALSVWIAPFLMPDAGATPWVVDGIYSHYRLFQRIHVLGLVWSVLVLISWLVPRIPR